MRTLEVPSGEGEMHCKGHVVGARLSEKYRAVSLARAEAMGSVFLVVEVRGV